MGSPYPQRYVTKSAFSQARQKLSHTAFCEMNRLCADYFYATTDYVRWRGKRVFAIDGSTLLLPNHPGIDTEFPGTTGYKLARITIAYDPFNELAYDSRIDPISVGERKQFYDMLDGFEEGDLFLFDRGYPSMELIRKLYDRKMHFCMRMPRGFNSKIDAFWKSGKKEQLIYFLEFGYQVKFKLYKITLPTGEEEVLLTDILDRNLQVKDFEQLYHMRWGAEEGYKYFKARMETANFSGKTPRAVRQDFHAKVFIMTLEAALRFPLDKKMKARNTRQRLVKSHKHRQKINRTNALALLMKCSLKIFLHRDIKGFLGAFDDIVFSTTESQIKGRASPRKPLRVIKYYPNYKRC